MPSQRANQNSGLQERLTQFRRLLHRHPELSLQEHATTAKIREALAQCGVEIVDTHLKTGICAIVRGRYPGACIGLRADIDALPIVEQTGLPHASEEPGKMHACGHDFHTAALLGAVWLAQERAASDASFPGSMLFIFQPAEEVGQGAKQVIDSGVLEAQGVSAIIGEHNQPALPAGTIGVALGPLMGSVDEFRIVIRGVGGHAAIPERTIDPILVASHVVTGLQHIVSRTVAPTASVVVTVGSFHAGTANNIIPPEAVLEGTVRCLQPEYRAIVQSRLLDYVKQTVGAFGAQADVQYRSVLPAVVNNPELAVVVRDAAVHVVGDNHVVPAAPSMAGEDFSLYQQVIPGCFFWVGTGKPDGSSKGWHHPEFDVDEHMLPVTSEVFVEAAIRWLQSQPK